MLYAGVHKNQLVAFGMEGEVFVFQGFAVEADEAAGLPEAGGELVHDAAHHAAVVMLCALAYLGKFELVDIVVEQFVEGEGEAALEGGRRRKACTQRNVACEHGVEALHGAAALDGFAADAKDVAGPLLFGLVFLAKAEDGLVFVVQAVHVDSVLAVGFDFRDYAFVDGAGEHVAAVVVGVLADEVDAPCGCEYSAAFSEKFDKFGMDFLLH